MIINGKDITIKPFANLKSADLEGADLRGANLDSADLRRANLWGADLEGADLRGANLRGANLEDTNLIDANIRCANIRCANIRDANLEGADLEGADLRGANLWGADLRGANLKNTYMSNLFIPEGSIIGYKKLSGGTICILEIPIGAKRVRSWVSNKFRCEFAKVLEGEGYSSYDTNFYYKVGEYVYPDSYNDDKNWDCYPGIHFFLTRQEAEEY
jgi:hypothetical protein